MTPLGRLVHAAAGLALLVLGAACAYAAWGPLQNLWRDYRDSPVVVYLSLGAFWLVLAALLAVAGLRLLRAAAGDRRSRDSDQ